MLEGVKGPPPSRVQSAPDRAVQPVGHAWRGKPGGRSHRGSPRRLPRAPAGSAGDQVRLRASASCQSPAGPLSRPASHHLRCSPAQATHQAGARGLKTHGDSGRCAHPATGARTAGPRPLPPFRRHLPLESLSTSLCSPPSLARRRTRRAAAAAAAALAVVQQPWGAAPASHMSRTMERRARPATAPPARGQATSAANMTLAPATRR